MNRDELVNTIACAIPTLPPSLPAACDGDGSTSMQRQIAADIVALVYQARSRDPLAVLPTDLGISILEFIRISDVARLREVSKRWCQLGNARMAETRSVWMASDESIARRKGIVQLVSRHCPSLRTLSVSMYGSAGYTAQDVEGMPTACIRVVALNLLSPTYESGNGHGDDCDDGIFPFAPLQPLARAGLFRSLVSLLLCLHVSDGDAHAMAGQMPFLRALCIRFLCGSEDSVGPPFTSRGLSALINGTPSLTVLCLECPAQLISAFPACRSGIRRLSLVDVVITDNVMSALLKCVGAELRALNVTGCGHITDESVECMFDDCPRLESLSIGDNPLITSGCLLPIVHMPRLQDLALGYPVIPSDANMNFLLNHARSPALRACIAEHGTALCHMEGCCYDFFSMLAADDVPVSKGWLD